MAGEKSVFVQVFGEYPVINVLNFLITFREFDYPLTEIAENSGVGWTTLHTFWPRLEKLGIVKQTRQVGRAKLYKLDLQNPTVQAIIKLDKQLCDYYARPSHEKSKQILKNTART